MARLLAFTMMAFAFVHENAAIIACSAVALEIERQRRQRGLSFTNRPS